MAAPSYSARCRPYVGSAARAYSSARHSVRRLYAGRRPPPSCRLVTCAAQTRALATEHAVSAALVRA